VASSLRKIVAAALTLAAGISTAHSADAAPTYPEMAALDAYLMPREQEIAMARSAAPASISAAAEVWVLGRDGYAAAAPGSNGFVCLVERAWSASVDDPEFWNPRLRAPICFNAAAARYLVPLLKLKTRAVLESHSKQTMAERVHHALDGGELPELPTGAMCFMMSRAGYLGDKNGHWHPHLMFFERHTTPAAWGANTSGSPVFAFSDPLDDVTTYLVPVPHWSDGTAESADAH
jgi:hypothetical protein